MSSKRSCREVVVVGSWNDRSRVRHTSRFSPCLTILQAVSWQLASSSSDRCGAHLRPGHKRPVACIEVDATTQPRVIMSANER
ncbi:hypothetical protein BBD39_11450 [Arsenophonus endosymbiont of Bemisia tabaci Asia II 3]|nr:hypothetical protein BBD39_11450 [Arsenophonus endosymbiont of Bemisia tabaci Asia II 3]